MAGYGLQHEHNKHQTEPLNFVLLGITDLADSEVGRMFLPVALFRVEEVSWSFLYGEERVPVFVLQRHTVQQVCIRILAHLSRSLLPSSLGQWAPGSEHAFVYPKLKGCLRLSMDSSQLAECGIRHDTYRGRPDGYVFVRLGYRFEGVNEFGKPKRIPVEMHAHRLVCWLRYGRPNHLADFACHGAKTCGRANRACCHPDHISWKTKKQDVEDITCN